MRGGRRPCGICRWPIPLSRVLCIDCAKADLTRPPGDWRKVRMEKREREERERMTVELKRL